MRAINDILDTEEDFSVPSHERRVITQAYDLSIQTLVEQWKQEILILPDIQREYLWKNPQASGLIESLLLNIPIPVLYFSETEDAKYEIIDGHQRVNSIARFFNNEFRLVSLNILNEYKGKRFHQLPPEQQRFLKMRIIRAVIISYDSHHSMKYEVFQRLNSGSITLSSQELRNSMYRGIFNNMLKELVKNECFRKCIGTDKPRKRMVDHELILRYFALGNKSGEYKPPLKRFLNDYMEDLKNPDEDLIINFKEKFYSTIERIYNIFGESAFRITDINGNQLERGVNRALFDAQMLVFSRIIDPDIIERRSQILNAVCNIYQSESFKDSIQRATGDRSRFRTRVRELSNAIIELGITIRPPFNFSD